MGKDNFTDTIIAEKVRIERKVQNYCAEIYFGKKILEKSSKAAFEKKNMDSQTVAVQLY